MSSPIYNQSPVVFTCRRGPGCGAHAVTWELAMGGENRRGALRQRVLKDGKIVTMDKWSLIDCTIRDLSETGARLRCADALSVPERFRLLMPSGLKIRDARVVWRLEGQVGITFIGPARRAPPRKW